MKHILNKIGTNASLKSPWGFHIAVHILDYKNSYGRDRWLVEPLKGAGTAWVENVEFGDKE